MKISTCQGPEPKPLLPRAGSPCVVSVSDGNPIFLVRQDKTFLHPQVLPSSHTPHLTCRHMLLALPQGTCSPACYHAVQASIASPDYRAGSCRAPARALCTPPHTVARAALPKCQSVRIPLLLTASEAACHCSSLQSPSHGPRCSPSSPLASPLRPLGFATVASLPPRSTPCEPPPGGLGLTVQNTPPPGVPLIRGHLL